MGATVRPFHYALLTLCDQNACFVSYWSLSCCQSLHVLCLIALGQRMNPSGLLDLKHQHNFNCSEVPFTSRTAHAV